MPVHAPSLHTTHQRALLLAAAVGAAIAVLASCGGSDGTDFAAATNDPRLKAAWVEMGPDAQVIARAITESNACPMIAVDEKVQPMSVRAAAGTAVQRTTASNPADSKPSAFPVTTCEATVPAGARAAFAGGRALALPKAQPERIIVLADTGCRMKKADNAFQACNDAVAWPLSTIAATAAAMKPDLVVHIGDYHYRENACPDDIQGCKDSPWGYGWDTWEADLFRPAAPLLAAAPWIVVRGNHEECARAGQGWARFMDVRPYDASRNCDLPANDNTGNFTEPYAVALGSDTRLIVFDSAKAGTAPFGATDFKFPIYQQQFRKVAEIAADAPKTTLFANHHPILAFAPLVGAAPAAGNAGLQAVMSSLNAQAYYPKGINVALHGHVHDFQAISFASAHPATFVAGNGGDNIDANLPDPFPPTATPAPGAVVERIAHTNTYGFMLMERNVAAPGGWFYKAYTRDGKLLTTCTQAGSKVDCDRSGFIAP